MIDSHLHLNYQDEENPLKQLKTVMKEENIEKAILYLINDNEYEKELVNIGCGDEIIIGVMLNPLDSDVENKLHCLKNRGIKIIKILPYEQKLHYENFDRIVKFAMLVQKYDMILSICGSYGSRDIFETNGVELAAKVLNAGFDRPLIIAHGGMVRQLEVHSLMCEYSNLFMDLSFTISYWWGTHIIDDVFFTVRKNGFNRVFWGSDYPYCPYEDAKTYFNMFCEKYDISSRDREKLLSENFKLFYEEYLK